jgi:hypothetical protein
LRGDVVGNGAAAYPPTPAMKRFAESLSRQKRIKPPPGYKTPRTARATHRHLWEPTARPTDYQTLASIRGVTGMPTAARTMLQVAVETVNHLIATHEVTIYSSVAEGENHVRLVTALKSGRLSGECGLGMRIGCERPVANSKLLLERNLLEGRLLKTGAYCG